MDNKIIEIASTGKGVNGKEISYTTKVADLAKRLCGLRYFEKISIIFKQVCVSVRL